MTRSVKLLNSADLEWEALEWQNFLPTMSNNTYLCSKGFVNADISLLFRTIADSWISFFQILGGSLRLEKISKHDYFPEDLSRVVSFEYTSEKGVIGYNSLMQDAIANLLAPQISEEVLDIALEYLELRLLSLLTRSLELQGGGKFQYCDEGSTEEIEIISALHLELLLGNKKVSLWFGLGKNLVERISNFWIEKHAQHSATEIKKDDTLTLVLDRINIIPSDLIDYTRFGAIIDLDKHSSNQAILRLNQQDFAEVELMILETEVVCQIKKLILKEDRGDKHTNSLDLEITPFKQIPTRQLFEGAVLKLENTIPYFSFNSEKIADLEIASIEGKFLVKVINRL